MALQMNPDLQKEIRGISGNKKCVDCLRNNPQWASVTMGTLMCLECSGKHRGLGVHISFVRSVQMDSWSPKQIQSMQIGGNDNFRNYLSKNNLANDMDIPSKYNQPEVELYALQIRAKRDGKPIPSTLPSRKSKGTSNNHRQSNSNKESPQERELRLRREAEERLRKKFGGTNLRGQGVSSSGQTSFSGGDDGRRNSGNSGLDDVGKSVGAAANVAGQALGQAFGWLGSTAKSTVETVREKDIGGQVTSGWNTVSDKVKSGEVTAAVSNGWSSFMSGATNLLRQVSGDDDEQGAGGQQQQRQEQRQEQQQQRQQPQQPQQPQQNDFNNGGGDDDAWLQEQLAQAKSRLSQQTGASHRKISSSSLSLQSTNDDDWGNPPEDVKKDVNGWGNEDQDEEDLELFLNSDDEDDDKQSAAPTSVLDMAARSRGNSAKGMKLGGTTSTTKSTTKSTTTKKKNAKPAAADEDFFGSFGF